MGDESAIAMNRGACNAMDLFHSMADACAWAAGSLACLCSVQL